MVATEGGEVQVNVVLGESDRADIGLRFVEWPNDRFAFKKRRNGWASFYEEHVMRATGGGLDNGQTVNGIAQIAADADSSHAAAPFSHSR